MLQYGEKDLQVHFDCPTTLVSLAMAEVVIHSDFPGMVIKAVDPNDEDTIH